MSLRDRTVSLLPGDDVVLRTGGAVVWAEPSDRTRPVLEQVVAAVEQTAGDGAPGRKLLRRLAGVVTSAEPDDVPAFAAVADTEDGLAVMVVGDVDVHVVGPTGAGEVLRGRDAATWVDRIVDAKAQSIAVVRAGVTPGEPDAWSDLRHGSARAGGVVLSLRGQPRVPAVTPLAEPAAEQVAEQVVEEPTEAIAQPAAGAAPPAEPPAAPAVARAAIGVDFTAVSLLDAEPPEPAEPLPLAGEEPAAEPGGVEVDGIWCSRRHFNDPRAAYCSVCGISMVHQTHNLVRGRRPSLGVLVLDDGSTFAVDEDYVLGREPDGDPAVASGAVLPLVVDDPGRSVSRVHARIALQGWDVRISDAGSANGTYLAASGSSEWQRLAPDEPRTLQAGTRIRLGQRELVFDSHHHA